jgi:hypothetical protein
MQDFFRTRHSQATVAASFLLLALVAATQAAPPARNTNQSRATRSVIAGGTGNLIQSNAPTAPGYTRASFIGAGTNNTIGPDAGWSVIVGGYKNTNTGFDAAIGGGLLNIAAGAWSTVPGGYQNKAEGDYSFAAGASAEATHFNAFVWGGGGDPDGFIFNKKTLSIADRSFTVRAPGGAKFYTSVTTDNGPFLVNNDVQWQANSDSNLKTDVTAVNHREVLSLLAKMPVTKWRFKNSGTRQFLGPMAQDFRAAFGLGSDDKGIGTLDADGVLFSAVKGLLEELNSRDEKIQALEKQNSDFRKDLDEIARRLDQLPPAN